MIGESIIELREVASWLTTMKMVICLFILSECFWLGPMLGTQNASASSCFLSSVKQTGKSDAEMVGISHINMIQKKFNPRTPTQKTMKPDNYYLFGVLPKGL